MIQEYNKQLQDGQLMEEIIVLYQQNRILQQSLDDVNYLVSQQNNQEFLTKLIQTRKQISELEEPEDIEIKVPENKFEFKLEINTEQLK